MAYQKSNKTLCFFALGCLFIPGLVAFFITALVLLILSTIDLTENRRVTDIAALPGVHVDAALMSFPCAEEWKEDPDSGLITCPALQEPYPIAGGVPTRVQLHPTEGRTVDFVHLTFAPYGPQFRSTGPNSLDLVTWADVVAASFSTEECPREYLPVFNAGIWDCDGRVIAHTSVNMFEPGNASVNLWIGEDADRLRPSVLAAGYQENMWALEQTMEAAVHYFESDRPALADESLLHVQFLLHLFPSSDWNDELQAIQDQVLSIRSVVHPLAAEERRHNGVPAPAPSFRGYIHPQVLLDRSLADLIQLLGPARACTDSICTFGDDFWQLQVTLTEDTSQELRFSAPQAMIPFDKTSLIYFDLHVAEPTHREKQALRWADFAGLQEVEFALADNGTLAHARFR